MTNQILSSEIESMIKDHVEGQFPKIVESKKAALIIHTNGKLYALGANVSGRFGSSAPEMCLSPVFIAGNVQSAALGDNYVVYVTVDGTVKIIGNGKLAEQFAGFSHAVSVVSNGDNSFWIEDDQHQWYGLGDNYFETIQKITSEIIHVFHEEEYPIHYTAWSTDSIGRYGNHRAEIPDAQIKANYRYQQFLKEYGEENISLHFKCLKSVDLSEMYYNWAKQNVFPKKEFTEICPFDISVIKKNRWIYQPELLEAAPEKVVRPILEYDVHYRKLCCKRSSVRFVRPGLLGDDYFTISVNEKGVLECNKESKSNKIWGYDFLYVWANGHHLVMINRNGKVWHGVFSDYFGSYSMMEL